MRSPTRVYLGTLTVLNLYKRFSIVPTRSFSYHELEQSKIKPRQNYKNQVYPKKSENLTSNVTSAYFLGFHLDSKLCWTTHGEVTTRKIAKNIFLVRWLKDQLPSKYLRNVYFAICDSRLRYRFCGGIPPCDIVYSDFIKRQFE